MIRSVGWTPDGLEQDDDNDIGDVDEIDEIDERYWRHVEDRSSR
jgi:hypothetical protein